MELRGGDDGSPDQADGLLVEIEGFDEGARLRWLARPGATYSVYRSTVPDFGVSDPGVVLLADDLVVGGYDDFRPHPPVVWSAPSAFYRVVEHTAEADVSSAVMGRLSRWALHSIPDYPPPGPRIPLNHNKVPICLAPVPADTLRQMLLDEDVLSIHWWDPALQGYHSDEPPFMSVLELGLGAVFSMVVPPMIGAHGQQTLPYHLTGRVPAISELVTGAYEGSNAVTWPITAAPSIASALLGGPGHMQHAIAIGWWDPEAQTVRWYPDLPPSDLPGVAETVTGDFEIAPCSALYVYIDAGYPEGTALKDIIGLTWPPALADAP